MTGNVKGDSFLLSFKETCFSILPAGLVARREMDAEALRLLMKK
jgi:hypothetical protein